MLDYTPGPKDKQSLWWLLLAWLVTSLALAGPTWQQLPQPVFKNQQALVILTDMSYSMAAEDVKPSRYQQVNHKITDILRARRDGLTALISYAGAAHTVTPLTDDTDTITNLLPSLSPYIMPKPGSRPDKAIELAQTLVTNSGLNKADILLVTDGIQARDIDRIEAVLDPQHFTLSILAVGTAQGAPIPLPKGGFLKDGNGTVVLPKLNTTPIEQLSSQLGVRWQRLSLTDQDWQYLLDSRPSPMDDASDLTGSDTDQRQYDLWQDQGYWLLLLILPIALMSFRRGVLFSLTGPAAMLSPALLSVWALTSPTPAHALEWQDLWKTPDQQGAELLDSNPAAAAERFESPDWQGSAAYRAGDYQGAIEAFGQSQTANGHYNRGNALAQSGQLDKAITAYDQALALEPDHSDAQTNRERVQEALRQQQEQQKNQGQQDQEQQDQSSDQQQSGEEDSESESDSNDSDASQSESDSQSSDSSSQSNNNDPANESSSETSEPDSQSSQDQSREQAGEQDQKQDESSDSSPDDQSESSSQEDGQEALNQEQLSQEPLNQEQQTRLKQWLNRVPDQPGKLLERKFLYQYQQQYRQSEPQEPEDVLW